MLRAVALSLALGVTAASCLFANPPPPGGYVLDSISIQTPSTELLVGETLQLAVVGTLLDGSTVDLTVDPNTFYNVMSHVTELSVDSSGLVLGLKRGRAHIWVIHASQLGRGSDGLILSVELPGDSDRDGLLDVYEEQHGFDPDVPGDGDLDPDEDGLTSIEEAEHGTDPREFDTDGDGWPDFTEVIGGTDPLVPDRPLPQPKPLNDTCVVSVLNRNAEVTPRGTWFLPDIPSNAGQVRVRATCVEEDGVVRRGQSDLITIPPGGEVRVDTIDFDATAEVPTALSLTAPSQLLEAAGESVQLTATATYPGGATLDVTAAAAGTTYTVSSSAVASVSADGLVTALASGTVLVSALNDGVLAILRLQVVLTGDSDGDGLPDDYEVANGLDPENPDDALADPDGDGLRTLDEFLLGTLPFDPDSDDDGLSDGAEVGSIGSDPLLFDTDGDGVSDGLEVQAGSDPLDRADVDLTGLVTQLELFPQDFTLIVNTVVGEASRRLRATGTLIDGTVLDITSSVYGTTYESSDPTIASFGLEDGRVFAGDEGAATLTATNDGLSAASEVGVQLFGPTPLSRIDLTGGQQALALAESGDFVYVVGSTALSVIDVSDPAAPFEVSTLWLNGAGHDIVVSGDVAFVAMDASISVVDLADPFDPMLLASVRTPPAGNAGGGGLDVEGGRLYLANGLRGLHIFDVSDPLAPQELGVLDTSGFASAVEAEGDNVVIIETRSGTLPGAVLVADVSDPTEPQLLATTSTRPFGDTRAADVTVRRERAWIPDGLGSLGGLETLDLSVPTTPVFVGSSNDAFGLVAVATEGEFAVTADYLFGNAVPVYNIAEDDPQWRGGVDFLPLGPADGIDVAVREGLVYLLAEPSQPARTSLFIGRYLVFQDTEGVAPTVSIITPQDGDLFLGRRRLQVVAEASDDIKVASVEFHVDGASAGIDFASPYEFEIELPDGTGELILGAVATDLAGDVGTAEEITVSVAPDGQPVARVLAPVDDASFSEGSTIVLAADASDDIAVTGLDLQVDAVPVASFTSPPFAAEFTIPLGATEILVTATAEDTAGQTGSDSVVVAVAPDEPPIAAVVEPLNGEAVLEGGVVQVITAAADDVGVGSMRLFIDDQLVVEEATSDLLTTLHRVPFGATEMRVRVEAEDTIGQVGSSPVTIVTPVAQPLTNVTGRVIDETGQPVPGGEVSCPGVVGGTDPDGTFAIAGVSTAVSVIACSATATTAEGQTVAGLSEAVPPSVGESTDVGVIVLGQLFLYGGLGGFAGDPGSLVVLDPESLGVPCPSEECGGVPSLALSAPGWPEGLSGIAFNSQGRLFASTMGVVSELLEIDPMTGVQLTNLGPIIDASSGATLAIVDLALEPQSDWLYGLGSAGELYRIDNATASAEFVGQNDAVIGALAFGPDGTLYQASTPDLTEGSTFLLTLDPSDGTVLNSRPLSGVVDALAVRPSDGLLFFSDDLGGLQVLDPDSGVATRLGSILESPADLDFLAAADPGTLLAGVVEDEEGEPVAGATVVFFNRFTATAGDGTFVLPGVPAIFGDVRASAFSDGSSGESDRATPVAAGVTDVGAIVIEGSGSEF